MLPHDLPPSSTVYYYFRRWQKTGVWQQLNRLLRRRLRKGFGRNEKPTAASVDSQSSKTTSPRGKFMVLTEAKRSKVASDIIYFSLTSQIED
jgi:putative transposase